MLKSIQSALCTNYDHRRLDFKNKVSVVKNETRKMGKETYRIVFSNGDIYDGELIDNKVTG